MKILKIDVDEDIKLIEAVTNSAFSSTPDSNIEDWFAMDELRQSILDDRGVCLKALGEDGGIVGTIHAMQENLINGREAREKWIITNLAIIPEMTGLGVGGELLTAIEKEVRDRQVKKLFVHTNLDDEKVIHFYEKYGYTRVGEIKDYYYAGSAIFLLKYL